VPGAIKALPKEPGQRIDGNRKTEKAKRPPQPLSRDWRTYDPAKGEGDQTLLEDLITYKEHLDELLKRKGDYVVIKGRQFIGIFADRQDAIEKAKRGSGTNCYKRRSACSRRKTNSEDPQGSIEI
jgi:hypothetical protein